MKFFKFLLVLKRSVWIYLSFSRDKYLFFFWYIFSRLKILKTKTCLTDLYRFFIKNINLNKQSVTNRKHFWLFTPRIVNYLNQELLYLPKIADNCLQNIVYPRGWVVFLSGDRVGKILCCVISKLYLQY